MGNYGRGTSAGGMGQYDTHHVLIQNEDKTKHLKQMRSGVYFRKISLAVVGEMNFAVSCKYEEYQES